MATSRHGVFASDQTYGTPVLRVDDGGEMVISGTAPDADTELWPINVPVDILGDITKAASLGDTGTLPINLKTLWKEFETKSPRIAVIRQEEIADPAQQASAFIGDPTDMTGAHAIRKVQSMLDFDPDLIITPGFMNTPTGALADAVITEYLAVAARTRACVFADGPNTTTTDAIGARENYSSDRLYLIDPHVTAWDTVSSANVSLPASGVFAAVQARMDLEKGFWWSFDNKPLRSITGIARPIDWRQGDPNCEAAILNQSQISTIYRKKGFWTWGGENCDPNRTLGGTIVGRRVADKLYDTLEGGLLPFIGVPTSINAVSEVAAVGTQFLRSLAQKGAIIKAIFELPEDLNSAEAISDGVFFYRLKFVEAVPMRDIEIWGYRTPELYEEFLDRAAAVTSFTTSFSDYL